MLKTAVTKLIGSSGTAGNIINGKKHQAAAVSNDQTKNNGNNKLNKQQPAPILAQVVSKIIFKRKNAMSNTLPRFYSTASHYAAIIDTCDDEQLQCYYAFLLFPPRHFVALRDLALITGIETRQPAPLVENEIFNEEEILTPIEKVTKICLELEQKQLLCRKHDRFNSKIGTSFFVEKDLHEAALEHFKTDTIIQHLPGVFLLIALTIGYVDPRDKGLDADGEAMQIVERLIVDPMSTLWEDLILTNGFLFRFFYGKYPQLAHVQNPSCRTALSMMATKCNRHDPVKFVYEQFPGAINLADNKDRTAVSLAAERGLTSIIKCLYYRFPEGLEILDQHGRSPLLYASMNGHVKAAIFLYEKCPAVFEFSDKLTGRDALSYAASGGSDCLPLVEFFVERQPESVTKADFQGKTPIFYAAAAGCLKTVRFLTEVESGSIVRYYDKDGRSIFSHAAENGSYDLVTYLYGLRPKGVFETDQFGRTALSYAATSGHFDTAQFLYDRNPDAIVMPDNYGRCPVFWAATKSGNIGLARFLYDCYPDVIKVNEQEFGQSAFLSAVIARQNVEMLTFLHGIDEDAVKQVDHLNRTCLSYAVEYNDKPLFDYLYQLYPDAIKVEDKSSHLPIWYAVVAGNAELVDRLHSLYPPSITNIDREDGNKNLLSLAAERGFHEIVQFLFGRSPELSEGKDIMGRTPLVHAVLNDHPQTAKYMARVYPDSLKNVDNRGRNVLTLALELRGYRYDLIEYLYKKWPDALEMPDNNGESAFTLIDNFRLHRNVREFVAAAIKKRDQQGRTPFYRAIVRGHAKVSRALLAIFPEAINVTDYSGRTAFFSAAESGEVGTLRYLLELNDEAIKWRDKTGRTSLFVAAKEGRLEACQYLYETWPEAYELMDDNDRTPMIIAQQQSHTKIVELFKKLTAPPVEEPEETVHSNEEIEV